MPHRDPETGQFTGNEHSSFDDIEVVAWGGTVGIEAANLDGGTGFSGEGRNDFSGLKVIDYDDIVDRNEELVLVEAEHHMDVYANSTETADGTVSAAVEVSADSARSRVTELAADPATTEDLGGDIKGVSAIDDSIDIIGRVMTSVGHAPFSDGSTGVGGGGAAGSDSVELLSAPAEFGRFHPRDELYVNGSIDTWNIDDAGVHVNLSGQHVYGVREDVC
jgi:hypothetical protein